MRRKVLCIRRGYHKTPLTNFCLTVPIKSRRTLLCFERILVSKSFKQRMGSFTVLSKLFLSHRTEKTSPGNHSVLQKNCGREKYFMDKKGGITIFRRKFMVSQCRKISWASLQCFRKIGVSKKFMHNREYHNFPSNFFVSQCRKTSYRNLLVFY